MPTAEPLSTSADPGAPSAAAPASGRGKLVLALLVVAALVTAITLLPVNAWLESALTWIRDLGWWGFAAFVGLYVLCCVLFVPGSVLTLGAGAAFGLVQGSLAVSAGATLGAGAAFLVGRYVARDAVAGKVAANARFAAVDEAVGREGFKIVLLTRLSPVFPFNLLNYAYGLTKVSFKDYFLGSWLGMIPGTILYVYLGYAARESLQAAEGGGGSSAEWIAKGVGLLATIVVTVFVTRVARRALDKAVPPADGAAVAAAGAAPATGDQPS